MYPDNPAGPRPAPEPTTVGQGPPGEQWTEPNQAQPPGPADPYTGEPAPQPPPRSSNGDPWNTTTPPPRSPPPARPPPEPPRPPDPPPARPAPQPAGLSADAAQILSSHNRYRAEHCAAPLAWSPKLEQVAQAWANSLKNDGCKFDHSGGQYGENLAAGTSGTLDGNAVSAMWYDEIKDYDFARGAFSMQTGHFTQVVWRGSTALGCAKATCRGMDIWVCNYDPPGNMQGAYRQHVLPRGNCK